MFSSVNIPFTVGRRRRARRARAYDNDIEDATVDKVSVLSNGDDIPEGTGGGGEAEEFVKIPAVSTDGSHILMTTRRTKVASISTCGSTTRSPTKSPQGKQSIQLIGMTSDGSKVVFSSRDHVTADDTDCPFSNDIYVWEEQTERNHPGLAGQRRRQLGLMRSRRKDSARSARRSR